MPVHFKFRTHYAFKCSFVKIMNKTTPSYAEQQREDNFQLHSTNVCLPEMANSAYYTTMS